MFFELIFLKFLSFFLYCMIAIIIWDVIVLDLLIEKIFSLILVFFLLSFWILLNGLEFLPIVILLLYVGAIAVLFLFVVMILNPDFINLLNKKQKLIAHLTQRNLMLKTLLQDFLKNDKNAILANYTDIDQELQKKLIMANTSKKASTLYHSDFFLSLLVGSFFGGLLSWHRYLSLKFFVSSAWVSKLLQSYSLSHLENLIEQQLGTLQLYGINQFAEIKMQAYYQPIWAEKYEVVNIGLILYTKYGIGLVIIGVMLLVSMMGAIILTLRQTTFIKRQIIGVQSTRYNVILKSIGLISL